MKTHVNLTVDTDVFTKAKNMDLNMSGEFNDWLRTYVSQQENDSEAINIELEKLKQAKLKYKLNNIKAELDVCEKRIFNFEESREEERRTVERRERKD